MNYLTRLRNTETELPHLYYRELMVLSYSGGIEYLMKHFNKDEETIRKDVKNGENMLFRMMDDNLHNLPGSFKIAKSRGWDKIFVFVDIHATILEPNYEDIAKIYCPMAKEVLQKMSSRKDVCLCLYTCSYPDEILEYVEFFKKDGIVFEHANENSETKNTKKGFFEDKPYMNVLLEDKAGFKSDVDWYIIDVLLDQQEPLI